MAGSVYLAEHGEGRHGLVLHTRNGTPVDQLLFQARWRAARKRARLGMRFHSLRHRYASTAIAAGVPLPALSRALGHSKPSITLDVYGHLMIGHDERLRDAATARFARDQARPAG
jgi:integrase